jgi:hypothetical protein
MATPESEALASEASEASQTDTEMFDVEIWRHAYSCANLKKDKTGNYLLTKFQQIWEQDPGLTIWGILTALKQSRSEKYKEYYAAQKDKETFVHVSVLFRTWATAICLYLPHISKDGELTLIVSPFLKEEGTSYEYDNTPFDFDEQISKLRHFYKILHECSKRTKLLPKHTITILDNVRGSKTYNVVFYYQDGSDGVSLIETDTNSIIRALGPINDDYVKDQNDYVEDIVKYNKDQLSIPDIVPMKYDKRITEINTANYLSSDLNAFLIWMSYCKLNLNDSSISRYFPPEYVEYMSSTTPTKLLRIVCHSDTMSTFCEKMNEHEQNQDLKKFLDKEDKTSGASTNMWGIKFTLTHNDNDKYNFKDRNFFYGAQKPDKTIPASVCERECDFGITKQIAPHNTRYRLRQEYRVDDSTRMEECQDIMDKGKRSGFFRSPSQKKVFKKLKVSTVPFSQKVADGYNASRFKKFFTRRAAGGKRKTRRINKQKITRKQNRKAQKSSKTIRRYSRR